MRPAPPPAVAQATSSRATRAAPRSTRAYSVVACPRSPRVASQDWSRARGWSWQSPSGGDVAPMVGRGVDRGGRRTDRPPSRTRRLPERGSRLTKHRAEPCGPAAVSGTTVRTTKAGSEQQASGKVRRTGQPTDGGLRGRGGAGAGPRRRGGRAETGRHAVPLRREDGAAPSIGPARRRGRPAAATPRRAARRRRPRRHHVAEGGPQRREAPARATRRRPWRAVSPADPATTRRSIASGSRAARAAPPAGLPRADRDRRRRTRRPTTRRRRRDRHEEPAEQAATVRRRASHRSGGASLLGRTRGCGGTRCRQRATERCARPDRPDERRPSRWPARRAITTALR